MAPMKARVFSGVTSSKTSGLARAAPAAAPRPAPRSTSITRDAETCDERRERAARDEADRRAVSCARVGRAALDVADVEELGERAEAEAERRARRHENGIAFVGLPSREREGAEGETDETASDTPGVAIGRAAARDARSR